MKVLFALLAIVASMTPPLVAGTKDEVTANPDCRALVVRPSGTLVASLTEPSLAEVALVSWEALVNARGHLLQKIRQEIFPIVTRAVAGRAKRENLRGSALRFAADAEVSRLNTMLFPPKSVSWYKTLISVFIVVLNRIGISSASMNKIVTETVLTHSQSLMPSWAREKLFAEVFRPSTAEVGVYEDLLRRINAIIDGPQDESTKVVQLSRILAGFIALTKVGSDLPTLINHAFVASPWVSATAPDLIDDLIVETLSLLNMNDRTVRTDEEAVPIEIVELLVRVWFRHASEMPLGEAILNEWKTAKIAQGGALGMQIIASEARLREVMPAYFVHSTQRYLYLPDLIITIQHILETDQIVDKDRALHHLVISLRGAGKVGNPLRSVRSELFFDPLTVEDLRLHFREAEAWYRQEPASRVIFDIIAAAALACPDRQQLTDFRDLLEARVFADEPPRIIAALRLLPVRNGKVRPTAANLTDAILHLGQGE